MTQTASADPAPLRLLPVPRIDPPYDDEIEPPVPTVAGSLALAFPPPCSDAVPLRLVPPAAGPAEFGPTRSDPATLIAPRPWTARFAQAVVEVLAGARPAGQLSRFTSLDVLEHLERAVGRLGGRPALAPPPCPRVSSVHVSEPCRGVVEACAIVDTGRRSRAVALRLEGIDGHWRCTALQVG
jgi:hypothetical protein